MKPRPSKRPAGCPDTCWVLRVSGEVDLATAPELERALEQVPGAARAVVVDLHEVTFMDCAALPALLGARIRHGNALSLRGVPRPVKVLLEATGLASSFVMHDEDAPCPMSGGTVTAGRAGSTTGGVDRCPGVHLRLDGAQAEDATDALAGPVWLPAPPYPPTPAPTPPTPAPTPALTPAPPASLMEQAVGLLMGTHRCGAEPARSLLRAAATAHGVSVVDLAVALTATASRAEEFRCTPATLAALIAVMKPDQCPGGTAAAPSPAAPSARVLPMVRQRAQHPGGRSA